MSSYALEGKQLSKKFYLKTQNALFNKGNKEFYALKNIDFEVREGDSFAFIGANGSGKSTLLKIIAKILAPDSGSFSYKGRLSALLEVGAGFHPELSGMDNIYLSGSLLGLSKNDIHQVVDQIIDFSGIEEFIYSPVKNYSSGMYVRLAFAVGAHIQSDILLVDEVLSVGDASFQRKCIKKIQSLTEESKKTVVIVSHNQGLLHKLCNRALLLNKGSKISEGDIHQVINDYTHLQRSTLRENPDEREGNGWIRVIEFDAASQKIASGSAYNFSIVLKAKEAIHHEKFQLRVNILDLDGNFITSFNPVFDPSIRIHASKKLNLSCEVPQLNLLPGEYMVRIHVWYEGSSADRLLHAADLEILEEGEGILHSISPPLRPALVVKQNWSITSAE